MGAYDTIAESFKEARVSLKEKRIQQVAPPPPPPPPPAPAPRAPVVPQRPAPAIPPLIAAPSVESDPAQELLTALSDLQERGQRYGVDTTQFNPRPGSTPFEFADEVHSVFDQIDSEVMADLQARQEYEQSQATAFRDEFDAAVAPPSPFEIPSDGVLPGVAVPSETPSWFNPNATSGLLANNRLYGPDGPTNPIHGSIRPVLNANTFEEFGRGLGDQYQPPDYLSSAFRANPLLSKLGSPTIAGDIAGPVLRGAAHTSSPLEIAFTAATALSGQAATQAIRQLGIPVISKLAGLAAPILGKGNFAQRLGVEWAAGGVAPEVGASAAIGALNNTVDDASAPVQILTGIGGGLTAAGLTIVAPRTGMKGLKASKDLVTEGIQTALRLGEDSATAVGKANTGNVLLPASPDPVVAARVGDTGPREGLDEALESLKKQLDDKLQPLPKETRGDFTPKGYGDEAAKILETIPNARIYGELAITGGPGRWIVHHIPTGSKIGDHKRVKDAKRQVQMSLSIVSGDELKAAVDMDTAKAMPNFTIRLLTALSWAKGDPMSPDRLAVIGKALGDEDMVRKADAYSTQNIKYNSADARFEAERSVDPREVEADRIIAEAEAATVAPGTTPTTSSLTIEGGTPDINARLESDIADRTAKANAQKAQIDEIDRAFKDGELTPMEATERLLAVNDPNIVETTAREVPTIDPAAARTADDVEPRRPSSEVIPRTKVPERPANGAGTRIVNDAGESVFAASPGDNVGFRNDKTGEILSYKEALIALAKETPAGIKILSGNMVTGRDAAGKPFIKPERAIDWLRTNGWREVPIDPPTTPATSPAAARAAGVEPTFSTLNDGELGARTRSDRIADIASGKQEKNYSEDIEVFADRIFREQSPDEARGALLGGDSTVLAAIPTANTPNLALGQGTNKGVLIEYTTEGLKGRPDLHSKPGLRFVAQESGEVELEIRNISNSELGRRAVSVTIDPKVADKRELRLLQRSLNNSGRFDREVLPDGKIRYTPKQTVAPTTQAAGTADARGADANIKDGELPVADDLPTSGQAAFDEAGEVGVRDVGPREDDIINDDSRRVQGGFFGEEDLKTPQQAAEMLEDTPFEKVYEENQVGRAERNVDEIIEDLENVQGRSMADEIVQGRVDRHDAPKGFSMRGISDDAIIKWMEANRPDLNPYETGVLHNIDFDADEYSALRQMDRTARVGKSRSSKAQDKQDAKRLGIELDEARSRLEDAEDAKAAADMAARDADEFPNIATENLFAEPSVSIFKLPTSLGKPKPRFGFGKKNPPLVFEDEFDTLLYIATRKGRLGNKTDAFGKVMEDEFGPEWRKAGGVVRQAGRDLEARIKELVRNAPDDGEPVTVGIDGAYNRLKAETGRTAEGRPSRSSTPDSGLEDARYTVDKETGEIIDIMRGPLTPEEVAALPEFLLARLKSLQISTQNPRPATSQMSAGGQGAVPDSGVRPIQGTGDPVEMGPPLDIPGSGGGVQQTTQGGVRPPLKTHPTEYVADVNTVKSVEAANAALKGEIIDSAVKESPEDMGASAQLETGKLADFLRYIVPRDHAVDEKFLTAVQVGENLRNVSAILARSLDPGRLWDTIQKGRHGGVISEFIGWPTRRILRAKLEMSDKMKSDFAALMTKHRVTKPKHMEAVGDVIEYIGTKDVEGKVSTEDLLSRKVVFKFVEEFPSDERRRIVELALETRNFYDKVLYAINYARIKRGDKPIPHLENYRPWIIAQRAWKERIKDGWKSKGAGGYEGMTPEMAEEVFGRRSYPTFMAPQSVMNDRAMQRTYGLKDVGKERDIAKLTYSYIDSALDDIYNNTIIANVTRHTKVLRENDLIKSADALDTWAQETYAGVPTPLTKFMRDSLPFVPVDHLMWVRRQLTRAVFPLNWSWNIAVQTSSAGLTYTRYGGMNTLKALNVVYDTTTNDWIKKHAYSAIMKKRNGGKVVYQDLGNALEKHATLEKSKFEKFEDIGNFLSSTIEERLTAHGIAAAKLKGEQLGLTGRSLIEFASEGGARTQSMYNREDTVGWLRSPEVGIIAPFQTFAFEMLNTLRELNIPILRGVEIPGIVPFLGNKNIGLGQAGAYETLSAKRITLGKQGTKDGKPVYGLTQATAEHRVKNVLRLVAAMYVTNLVQDKLMDRKPWNLGSFIPMYNLIVAGAAGSGPMNQPLYQKYSGDFFEAVGEYVETGRWQPLRNFGLRYYVFGGGQIARTWGGIEAVAEGGVRNRTGMKKFELTPDDQLAAYTKGVFATQPGKDYLDARVDRTAVEEFVGFDLPVIGGYSNGIKKEYRERFEEYYDIDKDIKGSKGRIAWRKKNWEVDANMFTVGIVRSIQSSRARTLAQELFEKHEIIDSETDPEDLEVYRRHLGASFVRKMLEGLEHTPGLEKLAPLEKLPDSSNNEGSSVPGLDRLSSSPTDQWNKVSNVLNIEDLVALKKIWSGETISRQETESLKIAFKKEPVGQTNFRKWSRQTLRQIQTNAANVRTQPKFANV